MNDRAIIIAYVSRQLIKAAVGVAILVLIVVQGVLA